MMMFEGRHERGGADNVMQCTRSVSVGYMKKYILSTYRGKWEGDGPEKKFENENEMRPIKENGDEDEDEDIAGYATFFIMMQLKRK